MDVEVQQVEQIADQVQGLENDGSLNTGQARSLVNKLNVATAMLNDGKSRPAANLLEAFVEQVRAMIDGGVLTPAEGQPLIDAAEAAIAGIE